MACYGDSVTWMQYLNHEDLNIWGNEKYRTVFTIFIVLLLSLVMDVRPLNPNSLISWCFRADHSGRAV
jgi:hypothetical protein